MTITAEQRGYARLAGITVFVNYLLQGLGDYPTILARRGETFVETARWAAASQSFYRLALLEVVTAWLTIGVLAFALYVVLEPVNKRIAQLAFCLRLGASFVGASSVMFRMGEARLYRASETEGLFTTEQLRTLVAVNLRSSGIGVETAWMLQAAGMLLFCVLLWRSSFIPRAISALGIAGSALLIGAAAAMIVFPQAIDGLKLLGLPVFLAEVAMAVWFLLNGLGVRAARSSPDAPR